MTPDAVATRSVPQLDSGARMTRFEFERRCEASRMVGAHLEGPPELIAEVAVTSRSIDLPDTLVAYRRNGVLEYIVWRVYDRALDWFALEEGEHVRLQPDAAGVIHSRVFPGLRLAVRGLLAGDMPIVLAIQHGD